MKVQINTAAKTKKEAISEILNYNKGVKVTQYSNNNNVSLVTIEGSFEQLTELFITEFYGCSREVAENFLSPGREE